MVNTQTFEKFLNCLINDMTYCLEEGIVKIEKIKKFELEAD
jgi:flagellar assembly factor FliW